METNFPMQNTGFHDIYPVFCGYEKCRNGHSFGPAVREYYLIHYVLHGRGVYECGKTYTICKNQCFLICPGEITFYKADENDPWEYCWVAFNGEIVETFLKHSGLGLQNPVFGNSHISELFEQLYDSMRSGRLSSDGAELRLLSMILKMFSFLPMKPAEETQKDKYINQAKNYISSMLSKQISVERLALYCGLDRRYLCRIFKSRTGLTLKQYITELKMQRALELLRSTPLSIGDVSRSAGYTDEYNFSKMFKKHFGISPQNAKKASP